MNASRKTILDALLAQATSAVAASFTATLTENSPILTGVSSFDKLAEGWPLFGAGLSEDCAIKSLSPGLGEIEMWQPATQSGVAVAITSGFQTTGKRVIPWHKNPAQPALFLRYIGDDYPKRPTGLLPKTELRCEFWVYAKSGNDPGRVPIDALMPLIDAIELSLAPSPAFNAQTLGGLVIHCWIEGEIVIDTGDIDLQAKAIIPIKILAP